MLIRLENEELVEYPDELGVLVLADPSHGDLPDFTPDLVNCLIHDALIMMFDKSLTLAQNIEQAQAYYKKFGYPGDLNMKKARTMIEDYNKHISPEDVGYIDRELMSYLYFDPPPKNTNQSVIIDQPSHPDMQSSTLGIAHLSGKKI